MEKVTIKVFPDRERSMRDEIQYACVHLENITDPTSEVIPTFQKDGMWHTFYFCPDCKKLHDESQPLGVEYDIREKKTFEVAHSIQDQFDLKLDLDSVTIEPVLNDGIFELEINVDPTLTKMEDMKKRIEGMMEHVKSNVQGIQVLFCSGHNDIVPKSSVLPPPKSFMPHICKDHPTALFKILTIMPEHLIKDYSGF